MTKLDRQWLDPRTGIVLLRFIKDDGGFHRTSITPGDDDDKQMALVNEHLDGLGNGAVSQEDLNKIHNTIVREHTPEVIARFRAQKR